MQSKVGREDSSSLAKITGKDEENSAMKKVNQELEEQIEKLKKDKQSQEKRFEEIQNNNNLLQNKLVQIQKEASRLSRKLIAVEEEEANTNSVPITVQKEVNLAEKQETRTLYRHPNYKMHFLQRQGENEHKQRSYIFKNKRPQNLQLKQKIGRFIQ